MTSLKKKMYKKNIQKNHVFFNQLIPFSTSMMINANFSRSNNINIRPFLFVISIFFLYLLHLKKNMHEKKFNVVLVEIHKTKQNPYLEAFKLKINESNLMVHVNLWREYYGMPRIVLIRFRDFFLGKIKF